MITELTPKQEKGITEWREHCLKIGKDTSLVNKDITEKSWKKFYKILGKKEPLFWYCQSPLQAQIIINIFPEIVKIFEITDKGANIRANIGANIEKMKLQHIDTYSWCQHDINWIAYYKYFEKYGLLPHNKDFEIFDIWYDLACSCGWCYTFDNIVFVCEKPCKLYLNNQGRLHKNSGMALEYSDSYGLYMLNGVRVSKEIVETPSEKLDPQLLLTEQNAEIRREIMCKIGISRILQKLEAKKLDSYREYELYRIENIDIEPIHILKMSCPSTGAFYTLRIPPDLMKAREAISWCNYGKEEFLIET